MKAGRAASVSACVGVKEKEKPTRTKLECIRCDQAGRPQPMTDAERRRRLAQLGRVLLQLRNARALQSNPDRVGDRAEAK